jgi:hypothetical protein
MDLFLKIALGVYVCDDFSKVFNGHHYCLWLASIRDDESLSVPGDPLCDLVKVGPGSCD